MKRIHLQFDDALYLAISRNAQSENISVSRYISMCIFDALTPRTKRVADVGMLLAQKERNEDEKKRSKRKEEVKKERPERDMRVREGFTPPPFTEVVGYANSIEKIRALTENQPDLTARFYDFYQSKGWNVGNQPMKNWKASFRNWIRRFAEFQPRQRIEDAKIAARDAKEERERERAQRERMAAAKDPANWQLCAERCANFRDGKCAKGAKWPPQFNDRPIPPQECKHFIDHLERLLQCGFYKISLAECKEAVNNAR